MRRRIFAAVTRIILTESERQPVLFLIENLHWADSETVSLAEALVEDVRDARVLLLASYRPEQRPAWRERAHSTEIVLGATRSSSRRACARSSRTKCW